MNIPESTKLNITKSDPREPGRLGPVLAPGQVVHGPNHLRHLDIGEKAKPPYVDAEDGCLVPPNHVGRVQQRSVADQHGTGVYASKRPRDGRGAEDF